MQLRFFKVVWVLSVLLLTLDFISFVGIAYLINWTVYYDFSKLFFYFLLFATPGVLGLISCYVTLGSFKLPKSQ